MKKAPKAFHECLDALVGAMLDTNAPAGRAKLTGSKGLEAGILVAFDPAMTDLWALTDEKFEFLNPLVTNDDATPTEA